MCVPVYIYMCGPQTDTLSCVERPDAASRGARQSSRLKGGGKKHLGMRERKRGRVEGGAPKQKGKAAAGWQESLSQFPTRRRTSSGAPRTHGVPTETHPVPAAHLPAHLNVDHCLAAYLRRHTYEANLT